MKKGAYYLMGGSQVKPLKTMLRSLLSATQKSTPHVLYIEAAGNTDPNLINGFLGNLRRNFDDISYDALNLYLQQPNAIGTKPENIKATFEKADIVFFEGGNLNILTELFQKHGLKDLCRTAFEKGAYVGGICAGGLILLDQIIYENNHGRITTMPGIGLVPSVAASCYIYDSDSGAERRDVLRGLSDTVEQTIGLGNNQAIIFRNNGTYMLNKNDGKDPAYLVIPKGKVKPLPYAKPIIF